MILGFSDAKLAVVKRGPEEVREQGYLADYIGAKVCPEVYRVFDDGYEMELLRPPPARGEAQLRDVMLRLRQEVWPRKSYRGWDLGWLEPLLKWSENAPWLTRVIQRNYQSEPTSGYCLIHGDPALANLMRRGDYLVITDPMPRMEYRKEIPYRREVDLGKLIQSAEGWERMLGCPAFETMWDNHAYVIHGLDEQMASRAILWGAIHLARVALRAKPRGRTKIAEWAEQTSRRLARSC